MDRVTAILRFQWRAYWRRFRSAKSISAGNAGVLVLFGAIGLVRYLQQLPVVAAQLAQGETQRYETLLGAVFLVWLFPVLGESHRGISSRALLHTPLTNRELFLIRFGSIFISPFTWILTAASLALVYPITRAANPLAGVVALLVFILFALSLSLTIAHMLSNRLLRRWLIALVIAAVGSWLVTGRLSSIVSWMPHHLVAEVAVAAKPFGSFGVLVFITIVSVVLSLWTFKGSLQPGDTRRSQKFNFVGFSLLPGKFGVLLKKDFRYLIRLLDLYLALAVAIMLSIYLAASPEPSPPVFRVVLVLLYLPLIAIASNCFGLDSALGLDRYAIFPLRGREILLTKNLSFFVIVISLFAAVLPFAWSRFDAGVVALGLIEAVLIGLAYLTWGNWRSIKEPYKILFYRFASGGSTVDAIMGMLFGSLPGAIMAALLYRENYGALWKIVLLVIVYVALYFVSVTWVGRRFEERREVIRAALT